MLGWLDSKRDRGEGKGDITSKTPSVKGGNK